MRDQTVLDIPVQDRNVVVQLEQLSISFPTTTGWRTVVRGVSVQIHQGDRIAIVGESGSGKTMLGSSLMAITPDIARVGGSRIVGGVALEDANRQELHELRGGKVAMVFQDPLTSLNPVRTVGSQLVESIRRHQKVSRVEARGIAIEVMGRVGVPTPEERFKSYPHELSGGLRQRVVIALALANNPDLVIADEPTTALDSTIQAQILEVFKTGVEDQAIVLITHDLAVAAEVCNRVLVMYAGKIIEDGQIHEVLKNPKHPYTEGLLAAVPSFTSKDELQPIPGAPPVDPGAMEGCRFAPRCPFATEKCLEQEPVLDQGVACWYPREANRD